MPRNGYVYFGETSVKILVAKNGELVKRDAVKCNDAWEPVLLDGEYSSSTVSGEWFIFDGKE